MSTGAIREGFKEAYLKLEEEKRNGTEAPPPSKAPSTLKLTRITIEPSAFQMRSFHVDPQHVQGICNGIKRGDSPPPLTVWWSGRRWVCIDGHHRLEALKMAGRTSAHVEVFRGTLEEARVRAAKANSRDKLPLLREEKLSAGWSLVCSSRLSKHDISKAAGISSGTVGNMRKALELLRKQQGEKFDRLALAEMRWYEIQGRTANKGDWDTFKDKLVLEAVEKLNKAFKPKLLMGNGPLFEQVLQRWSPAFWEQFREHLGLPPESPEGPQDF